jgi:hypothetical protein
MPTNDCVAFCSMQHEERWLANLSRAFFISRLGPMRGYPMVHVFDMVSIVVPAVIKGSVCTRFCCA